MANTYSKIYIHLVFGTKNQKPLINPAFEKRLKTYINDIVKQQSAKLLAVGGVQNHLHLLLIIPPSISISDTIQHIKSRSSRWLNKNFFEEAPFRWQRGYGAFSINESLVPATIRYINKQQEHHLAQSYKDEFSAILRKHNIKPR